MTPADRTAAAITGRLQRAQVAVMRLAVLGADVDHVETSPGRAVIVLRTAGRLAEHLDAQRCKHWSGVSQWNWCELDGCIVWWRDAATAAATHTTRAGA